jgi:hypothetical protein
MTGYRESYLLVFAFWDAFDPFLLCSATASRDCSAGSFAASLLISKVGSSVRAGLLYDRVETLAQLVYKSYITSRVNAKPLIRVEFASHKLFVQC